MRTLFFSITLSGLVLASFAQEISNPNLKSMVEAERAFVQMAKEQNRRDAFLFYLSDDAVTSSPKGPVKGKDNIRKQPVATDWLYWEVAYSDIAASGDFGFNSGPWEYRRSRDDEKAVAFGDFNSVWKRGADGSWRNVLDIGVAHGEPEGKVTWSTTARPSTRSKKNSAENVSGLFKVEKEFIKAMGKDRKAACEKYISNEARLTRSGNLPFLYSRDGLAFLEKSPAGSNITQMGGEAAASGDMGYVYGSASVTVTRDGKSEEKIASYVRIWKIEDGKHWRIVLDVLSY